MIRWSATDEQHRFLGSVFSPNNVHWWALDNNGLLINNTVHCSKAAAMNALEQFNNQSS